MVESKPSRLLSKAGQREEEESNELSHKSSSNDTDKANQSKARMKGISKQDGQSSVVYIGHLPDVLSENDLRILLKQFGTVKELRISRSNKTGRSRGFAFCNLASPKVASIVADTLSGYLLFDAKQRVRKRLVCHIVPPDKLHPGLFLKPKPAGSIVDRNKKASQALHQLPNTLEEAKEKTQRLVAKQQAKRQKLQAMGIDYDFPGYSVADSNTSDEKETPSTKAKTSSKKKSSKKKQENEETKPPITPAKLHDDKVESSLDKDKQETSESKLSKKRKNEEKTAEPRQEPATLTESAEKHSSETKDLTRSASSKKEKKKKSNKRRKTT